MNARPTKLGTYLAIVLKVWFAGCVVTFFAHILTLGMPRLNCQLPWSDIRAFVVSRDGYIFVRDGLQHRLLCFDPAGQFCYSILGCSSRASLAIDGDDRLYLGNVELQVLNLNGELLRPVVQCKGSTTSSPGEAWSLGKTGEPEAVDEQLLDSSKPKGTVQPGESLFDRRGSERNTFLRQDGTLFRQQAWSISQQLPDGNWRTVVQLPWYLIPFSFPCLPICWFLFLGYCFVTSPRKSSSPTTDANRSKAWAEDSASRSTKSKQSLKGKHLPWEMNNASAQRWPVSFWRSTLPPIVQSASEMQRRLGMLQQFPDCCWNDIEVMFNPGQHPTMVNCIKQMKSHFVSNIQGALAAWSHVIDQVLSSDPQATRDDVCQGMEAYLQKQLNNQ